MAPCRIEPQALKNVDEWLERYREFWEASLDRLGEYLDELQAKEKPRSASVEIAASRSGASITLCIRGDQSVILAHQITPCLWFDNRIEEAVKFYISVFGGKIHDTNYYGEGAPQPKGTVLTVTFMLKDQEFVALNGGPHFKVTEAVSFYVRCETQAEVDNYWNEAHRGRRAGIAVRLAQGQIRPVVADRADRAAALISDKDPAKAQRVMQAMMKMRKIDIAAIEKAHAG